MNTHIDKARSPLVTAVIIFLNEEHFLGEAIESVFTQTYDHWEMLLVDDGSTDRSSEIARSYSSQCPEKVRYVEHEGHQNLGKSSSRNLGILHAKGEYIAFLDGDDVWLPHKLERQVIILESHPKAAMVYGPLRMWYNWSGSPEFTHPSLLYGAGSNGIHPYRDSLVEPPRLVPLFLRDESFIPGGVLIRKQVLKKVGGYEEQFRDYYEDWVVMCKVCLTSPVFVSSEVSYKYRKHPNSSTYVWELTGRDKAYQLKFCNWMETYLSEQGITDSDVWQALRKKRRYCRYANWYRLLHSHTYLKWIENLMIKLGRRVLPASLRRWLWIQFKGTGWPLPGWVRMGSLRRVTPISHTFGYERGHPIDRCYIEQFLERQADDIRGHVLESGDAAYTRVFGGDQVTHSSVLHKTEDNPRATIVADLTCADQIPSNTFDCIILTQVLQFIYDVRAAIKTIYRILKPGGVVLVTIPGITPICHQEMELYGQYWSFTSLSIKKIFEECFPSEKIKVEARGNVLVASAFLYGLAVRELRQKELDYNDPGYEVIITLRAEKPGRKV